MERMISYEDLKIGVEYILKNAHGYDRPVDQVISDYVYNEIIRLVQDLGNPNNWIAVISPEWLSQNARHNAPLTFDNAVKIVFQPETGP